MASFAVVGHVEWVHFGRVAHVPRAGEVEHARESFEEPAGGGAVAAVQLARLAGSSLLLTALGRDEAGSRSLERLRALGVEVHAATRSEPTRRAVTLLDDRGERTITTFGPRLEPRERDRELPWERLATMDGIYFTAGDRGALHAARAGRVLSASPRARDALAPDVRLDALVLSAEDEIERGAAERVRSPVRLLALTDGARGGSYRLADGSSGRWRAARAPGPVLDSYGCGDSFAAGLTYGLASGLEPADALALAARCGAVCATGRGPYEHQLDAQALAGERR